MILTNSIFHPGSGGPHPPEARLPEAGTAQLTVFKTNRGWGARGGLPRTGPAGRPVSGRS